MSFLIGAATSGSGKTTLSMGLMRAFCRKGWKVQPFKSGPDYIDTLYHEVATGVKSVNLDTFLSSASHVQSLFQRYGCEADVCLVEGAMGLYDGYDGWHGSCAEIAMLLDIPVVMVINAKSAAYSVAPLIHGFRTFLPPQTAQCPLRLAGVVFTRVGSERHLQALQTACKDVGLPCLGYMRQRTDLVVPSRHLGLDITQRASIEQLIEMAANEVEEHVDLETLLKLE